MASVQPPAREDPPRGPADRAHLICARVPPSLHAALQAYVARTGDSMHHAVEDALARYFARPRHTLFQVGTEGALVRGVSTGCMRVEDLLRHGDFGLGTFDHLDGDGVLLDGVCWRAEADGTVARASPRALTPFWVVTHFRPERMVELRNVRDLPDLVSRLDQARTSPNLFAAARVRGRFSSICWHAPGKARGGEACEGAAREDAPAETPAEPPEGAEAPPREARLLKEDVDGSLVAFHTPSWAESFSARGWQFHFLSDDRVLAGRVHAVTSAELRVELHDLNDVHVALPETAEFARADLTPAELKLASLNIGAQ
ncbi:hypothetical protein KFE25_011282 [Diacronema lutheri]|uniref:Alpha-acetolactate decarboxylase n=1 Tax=Diacronema lutheri TaxID=2081491 RepID=A0A8J5XB72_DIALT|nr:hypothetical protein KFE25_011282 [Diacronema lutheri]